MKTKRGGRELNPTDAFRKQSRKREIKRNKAERTYIRDAFGKAQNTSKLGELKAELEELIKIEQTGELNKLQKLRKRVVLEAYEVAVRKKKVSRRLMPHRQLLLQHAAAGLTIARHDSSSSCCCSSFPCHRAAVPCTSLAVQTNQSNNHCGVHLVSACVDHCAFCTCRLC
jgi:hypothetical protein